MPAAAWTTCSSARLRQRGRHVRSARSTSQLAASQRRLHITVARGALVVAAMICAQPKMSWTLREMSCTLLEMYFVQAKCVRKDISKMLDRA